MAINSSVRALSRAMKLGHLSCFAKWQEHRMEAKREKKKLKKKKKNTQQYAWRHFYSIERWFVKIQLDWNCATFFSIPLTLSSCLFFFFSCCSTMYNYLFWNVPSACRCVYYAVMYTVVWQCSTSGGEHYNAVLHPLFARSTHVYPSIKKTFRSLRPKPGLENIS